MNDRFTWTAGLGRWRGVALQVHLLFLLFALTVLCIEWRQVPEANSVFGTGLVTIAVVFVVALLHELAHVWATANLGGGVRQLILTPWGGPSDLILPPQPRAQCVVHCAGPFLNLLLFSIGAFLLVMTGRNTPGELTNPLMPLPVIPGQLDISLVQIATWVNFQMLMVNLIPAAPLDGSRILRSGLQSWNPHISGLRLESIVLGCGIASGLSMFLFAWLLRDVNYGPVQPTWFVLAIAGVTLIFSARHQFHQWFASQQNDFSMLDELLKYESMDDDFPEPSSEFEDDDAIAEWMVDQIPRSEMAERSVAIEEERRVDVILEKLHQHGIETLTEDERMFLDRISRQYRRRRESNQP